MVIDFHTHTFPDPIAEKAVAHLSKIGHATAFMDAKRGTLLQSTGNETANLCQESVVAIDEPTNELELSMPAHSLNTFIFMIDQGNAAIEDVKQTVDNSPKTYYDLQGRRLDKPHGLCIEKSANGRSRKLMIKP